MFQKNCRENKNTHFIFDNFFSKNRALYETMSKNILETGGRWQYGGALHAGLVRLRAQAHASTCVPTPTHAHASMHKHSPARARTHKHTYTNSHTEICSTYRFSTATVVTCTRLDTTLYVHCLSCSCHILMTLQLSQKIFAKCSNVTL